MKTSMSRKGKCYDNAPMQSFWGTLKNESLIHYRFNTRNEAISVIREYIEIFYNHQRRHSRLGNTSPAAFRKVHIWSLDIKICVTRLFTCLTM